MPKGSLIVALKEIPAIYFSLLIHGLVFASVYLTQYQQTTGKVSILQVELGGPAGEGLHSEVKKTKKKQNEDALDKDAILAKAKKKKREAEKLHDQANSDELKSGTANKGVGEGGGNASEVGAYIAEVTRLINETKKYPRLALLREEEGQVLISFDVALDGTLSNPKVETPSTFDALNEGAKETVLSLKKLPPLPVIMRGGAHLHIPILYQINR
ncbi:MAG: energy transducer TonB [Xanthomonadaceae bacterium]|nr:energy transducer TonB [Xanthomonadaceae bacterium]